MNIRANLKECALSRAARSITSLKRIRDAFYRESDVLVSTTVHSTRSEEDDINKVVSVVESEKVLVVKAKHARFRKFPAMQFKLDKQAMMIWIKQKHGQMSKYEMMQDDDESTSESETSGEED